MKRAILLIISMLLLQNILLPDTHVKEVVKTEKYILGIRIRSVENDINEAWIGNRRIALVESKQTMILDLDKNLFIFINPRSKTYVECSLPVDETSILSDEVLSYYKTHRRAGNVKATGRTKNIAERECKQFEVLFWNPKNGERENLQKIEVWGSTDVAFDLELYYNILDVMRKIHNRDKVLRKELSKIKGLQMRTEITLRKLFRKRRIVGEAVEVSDKEPPAGIYAVPEGYLKREKLTPDDFK